MPIVGRLIWFNMKISLQPKPVLWFRHYLVLLMKPKLVKTYVFFVSTTFQGFLEARTEICNKIRWFFGVWEEKKNSFEINWQVWGKCSRNVNYNGISPPPSREKKIPQIKVKENLKVQYKSSLRFDFRWKCALLRTILVNKLVNKRSYVQGISHWTVFYELALTDGNV